MKAVTDFFVLATGKTDVQVRAIAGSVEARMELEGMRPLHRDGGPASGWQALDYGGVIVHLFLPDSRAFYGLERIWADARVVNWDEGR